MDKAAFLRTVEPTVDRRSPFRDSFRKDSGWGDFNREGKQSGSRFPNRDDDEDLLIILSSTLGKGPTEDVLEWRESEVALEGLERELALDGLELVGEAVEQDIAEVDGDCSFCAEPGTGRKAAVCLSSNAIERSVRGGCKGKYGN